MKLVKLAQLFIHILLLHLKKKLIKDQKKIRERIKVLRLGQIRSMPFEKTECPLTLSKSNALVSISQMLFELTKCLRVGRMLKEQDECPLFISQFCKHSASSETPYQYLKLYLVVHIDIIRIVRCNLI